MYNKLIRISKGILVFLPFLMNLFFSCSTQDNQRNTSRETNGIQHQLIAFDDNQKKLVKGDFVFLDAEYSTSTDSIFWTSQQVGEMGYFFKLSDSLLDKDFFHLLYSEYETGDSIHFQMDKEKFFDEVFVSEPPVFLKNHTRIKVKIKIDKSINQRELDSILKDIQFKQEARKYHQKEIIEVWMKKNMKQPVEVDSLLFFEKTHSTSGKPVKSGLVQLSYEGYFLDGILFERITTADSLVINFGKEGQLISGLEEVLSYLHEGENAKIILPSWKGFGERGSINGRVPPNVPLIYNLSINKCD
jgi:FKBP-type peptidyl-prolyl cis-trans isomerase